MEDQVLQLQRRGIAAACLHSGLDPQRRQQARMDLQEDRLRLLYVAPERLQGEATRGVLEDHARSGRLVALAVDEAHCISAWGHDFRPDYRRLGQIRGLCPGVPMLALSATAAPRVRADIIRLLDLRAPLVQVSSARRTNLTYAMRRRPRDPMPAVLEALDPHGEPLSSMPEPVDLWSAGQSVCRSSRFRPRRITPVWNPRNVSRHSPISSRRTALSWWPRWLSGWGLIAEMSGLFCTWIFRQHLRATCRNQVELDGMDTRRLAWCSSRPAIAPARDGPCRRPVAVVIPQMNVDVWICLNSNCAAWKRSRKGRCVANRRCFWPWENWSVPVAVVIAA